MEGGVRWHSRTPHPPERLALAMVSGDRLEDGNMAAPERPADRGSTRGQSAPARPGEPRGWMLFPADPVHIRPRRAPDHWRPAGSASLPRLPMPTLHGFTGET